MGIEDRKYVKARLTDKPPKGYWRPGFKYERKSRFPRWIIWLIIGLVIIGLLL